MSNDDRLADLTDDQHRVAERVRAVLGDPPERDAPMEEWSPDDFLEHRRTGAVPESAAHREYRQNVSAAAGLPVDASVPTDPEQMTVEQMAARKYPGNERN